MKRVKEGAERGHRGTVAAEHGYGDGGDGGKLSDQAGDGDGGKLNDQTNAGGTRRR